ncbi:MAG: Uma2 family endonuclease [Pirellulaceae bacterium]
MLERLYTAADIAAMPSDLPSGPARYELDNGRLITTVPPGFLHGSIELRIGSALYTQGELKGHGKGSCGEAGIILWRNPDRVVGADVLFIAKSSLPIRRSPDGYLETIPDVVIEITSKNDTKDYVARKTADYLQAGVKQVCIVDPFTNTITVHAQGKQPVVLTNGDVWRLEPFIPGFKLAFDDIFKE